MKVKVKALVTITSTKCDSYGNVYHAATIENLRNGKRFTTGTPSKSNVDHILHDAFGAWEAFRVVELSTGSARISSLPKTSCMLNQCHFGPDWKKALNSIGFRLPKAK